ncbi:MAG: hypothetical protein AAF413_01255 [Patescibacteria group bacterium]
MNGRVFFGIILMLVGITVLIILVTRLVGITRNGSTDDPAAPSLSSQVNDGASLTMEKRGRLIADENHFGYRIIINDERRILETYQGYEKNIVDRHLFDNNDVAYEEFIEAISRTGLTGIKDPAKYGDGTGLCPLGTLNLYELTNGPDTYVSQYQTSCGDRTTSASNLETLFRSQIPGFSQLISGIRL